MNIDFEKYADGLAPAVVQDAATGRVLMLGFMNREAFGKTTATGRVTFFSRSRRKIWTKGETSGNFLDVDEILVDCDADTILVRARPRGPVCHTGADTCFGERNEPAGGSDFLFALERVIRERRENPTEDSYTSKLFAKGLNKIAQKVGEEAVELIIEAKDRDDELFRAEAADLLYHLLVLFAAKNIALEDVLDTLKRRRR
ncbi:MAG: bifunctional phosphoribosyl-AMP cyclohydrolase/phosphoribosyl-ATP diphosphatase HisIE [Acidobacteria bacterium]|nr:bifunctional phosphoribosyl-AMP cyclohydrolase/phosphoribosyl-ATP diphosphatase HisIE [Acidobacteriota bacterium]